MAAASGSTESASLCKRCKNKVVNGVKCKNCNTLYHPSCAKISGAKIFEENIIDCCATVQCDSDSAFFDALDNICDANKKIDISIFQYVIKQKDTLINELNDKIKLLYSQIDYLKKNSALSGNNETIKKKEQKTIAANSSADSFISKQEVILQPSLKERDTDKKSSKSLLEIKTPSNINKNNNPVITNSQVAAGIMNAEHQVSLNKYINLTKEDGPSNARPVTGTDDRWHEVRKKRSRPYIFGKNRTTGVKGVPKMAYLHVSRVDPSNSLKDMQELLSSNFPEVKCEIFTPKHPSVYSSFKVSIYESNFKVAMDPEVWPYGSRVARFLVKRKIQNTDS